MSRSSGGAKPLSGGSSLTARSLPGLEDALIAAITGGGITFNNINITGGIIDGVVIGENLPGPGYFTSLQVGKPDGTGGPVCFYGTTVGEFACWRQAQGLWEISGELSVSQISDLGNIRVSVNTISANNTNGNINLASNGSGIVNITGGGLSQSTSTGNIIFNTTTGNYTLNSRNITQNSSRNTNITTTDGRITFSTGTSPTTNIISFISTGAIPTITTTTAHGYVAGDKVTITGTNSSPNIDGVYTIVSAPTTTSFTINASSPVLSTGSSGSVIKRNDINLNPLDYTFVTSGKPMAFGDDSNNIIGNSVDLTISAKEDINLSPVYNINIPDNKLLTFGLDTRNIQSDGTDLIINTPTKLLVNGDFEVSGTTTSVRTVVTTLDDPVITLGGVDPPVISDIKDRGVEFRYHNGITSKIGFFGRKTSTGCFTYIPDAVNTNEVFTGPLGCVEFGAASVTSLNVNGGTVNNIGTINTCNLSCNSTMTISAVSGIQITTPTTTITSELSLSDSLFTVGTTSIGDTTDKGFVFNYYDSGNKQGFIGWDSSSNCFKFLKDVTVSNNTITSGTAGNMCLGDTTVNNLTVTGNFIGGSAPEHLSSLGGGILNPSATIEITFISITSAGNVSGTLPPGTVDGFKKKIFFVSTVSNSTYNLSCPSGRLIDPGSGTTNSKTLTFKTPGTSVYMIWNANLSTYVMVNAGVCIS
jgi:hypothetical protein